MRLRNRDKVPGKFKMTCSRCKKEAVIELRYSGESLCRSCFLKLFEKRVRKTIRANKLIRNTDKTAVALSGGKDSAVVLGILNELFGRVPCSCLIAITIEQGGGRFQNGALKDAKSLSEKLGIDHHIYSFKEEFGITLDEIVKRSGKLENPPPPCSYCGVLRRKLLNEKARKLGVTKIATGHSLDDEVQTGLMNFIRGDLDRMVRMGPLVGVVTDEKFIPRIKPLRECPENEVELYANLKGLEFKSGRCPYSKEAFRGTIRGMVNGIEEKHPGSKFQILRSTDELIKKLRGKRFGRIEKIGRCRICGDPTSGETCRFCEIRGELGFG